MTRDFCKADRFGDWELVTRIGRGGNGQVWKCRNRVTAKEAAIKLSTKTTSDARTRFMDEIRSMKLNADIGVLPILDSSDEKDGTNPAWYVAPLCQSFKEWRDNKSAVEIGVAFVDVIETLRLLHDRNFYHRDIKPHNLLFYQNQLRLGDFGLVTFPEKTHLTGHRQQIGPRFFLAPEVYRGNDHIDWAKADLYSLTKTLWAALTNEDKAFEGQYIANNEAGLSNYSIEYAAGLDEVFAKCTSHDPTSRPSVSDLLKSLQVWITTAKDFDLQSAAEWSAAQRKLFPTGFPNSAEWNSQDAIVEVLNTLSDIDNLNHMFFPGGGGFDLRGAGSGKENGTIELYFGESKLVHVVRPSRLLFESFKADEQWNYFRLECQELSPSGIYKTNSEDEEELVELPSGKFLPRSAWDEGEHNGVSLPEGSRLHIRIFRGSFVIFGKTSIYNRTSSTYDGRHNKMNASEFKDHIERSVSAQTKRRADHSSKIK